MNKFTIEGIDHTGKKNKTTVNNDQLIKILLSFAGGGYTTSQTIKAMGDRRSLIDNGTIKRKYKKHFYTFKAIDINS